MNKHIILALKIILSGILLAYLLSIIPVNEIIESIISTNLFLFISGLLLVIPIIYLSAFETRYLTSIQGINLSVWEIIKIHLATSFYGLFLPGILSAGAVKWYKFSRFGKKSAAAAVVVFNRFLEVLMIVFIGILASLPIIYSSNNLKLFFALAILFVSMIIFYILLFRNTGLDFIKKYLFILPLPGSVKKASGKFFDSMLQFQNLSLKEHFKILGLLFLYHGIGVISFLLFAKSLNINLSIWSIAWIRSVMALSIILPLSFAGLGIREGTLVFLLYYHGIKSDISMALSFLFFSRNILTSLTGGLIELKEFIISKKRDAGTVKAVGE